MANKISLKSLPFDVSLFLILIPFFNIVTYYLTYSKIEFNLFLVVTFLLDTVEGFLGWWGIRIFIQILDKKYPYHNNQFYRILLQTIGCLVVGLTIIALTTELESWIFRGHGLASTFYTYTLIVVSIWVFVINAIYIGLHYYNELQTVQTQFKTANETESKGFKIDDGKVNCWLPFEDILGLKKEGEYAKLITNHKSHYLAQSLSKIEAQLPQTSFFRINRQYILHRNQITGFERAKNGKLQILVKTHPDFEEKIPLSRTKATTFKNWLEG